MLALASQVKPLLANPRRPPTSERSIRSPPNCGVNPPGNRLWRVKQFGSASTAERAPASGTWSTIGMMGQPPAPGSRPGGGSLLVGAVSAQTRSPTSSVRFPSTSEHPTRCEPRHESRGSASTTSPRHASMLLHVCQRPSSRIRACDPASPFRCVSQLVRVLQGSWLVAGFAALPETRRGS